MRRGIAEIALISNIGLIIETISEDFQAKTEVYEKIAETARERTIIANNSSSISIDSFIPFVKKPDRFIGIHFFNPASS